MLYELTVVGFSITCEGQNYFYITIIKLGFKLNYSITRKSKKIKLDLQTSSECIQQTKNNLQG